MSSNCHYDARRDIRTLLLCKIHRDHRSAYTKLSDIKNIYKDQEPSAIDYCNYFTVGGFDALITYKLTSFDDNPDIESNTNNEKADWMELLLDDKKRVLGMMPSNISFHPIHIIANERDEKKTAQIKLFWEKNTIDNYPFLLVTFVYGVSHHGSSYEQSIWDALDKTVDKEHCPYVVYNSVNLCDIIVLWRTKDIPYALEMAMSISHEGYARKTYTFVNLPLVKGEFASSIKDALYDEQYNCKDNTKASLFSEIDVDSQPGNDLNRYQRYGKLSICVRGSIRDAEKFNNVIFSELIDKKDGLLEAAYFRINYGENDFVIAKEISGESFYRLLEYFVAQSEGINDACWYIYTEFQSPYKPPYKQNKSNPLPDILSNEYAITYSSYNRSDIKSYPWAEALLELVSIHTNIDRLPVLHGPAYLIWGSLHVVNLYLKGDDNDYPKGEKLDSLLRESQKRLEFFVRAWSQLTDQITKVDDVIFHRLGNTALIYNTLSESILEFYHLFLGLFARALIRSDAAIPHCTHSFLLVPTLSQQLRIQRVFKLDPSVLSEKQVYTIEFPVDYSYMPRYFIIQLAHECLHSFGRKLRKREERFKYILSFMSFEILNSFITLSYPIYLSKVIYKELKAGMEEYSKNDQNVIESERRDRDCVYLDRVVVDLKRVIPSKILTHKTYLMLCKSAKENDDPSCNGIFSSECIQQWVKISDNYRAVKDKTQDVVSLENTVDACKLLFRECYADVMAIKLLRLQLSDYIEAFAFDDALPKDENPDQEAQFIQRLAIVITAAYENNLFTNDSIVEQDSVQPVNLSMIYEQIKSVLIKINTNRIYDRLYECIYQLLAKKKRAGEHKWPPIEDRGYFTLNALRCVIDYLHEVLQISDNTYSEFTEVQSHYERIIKTGAFFTDSFYNSIFEYHQLIQEEAKPS